MTGSRDIEGMVVFAMGRVINAWLVEECLFAIKNAFPEYGGMYYVWWTGGHFGSLLDNV